MLNKGVSETYGYLTEFYQMKDLGRAFLNSSAEYYFLLLFI